MPVRREMCVADPLVLVGPGSPPLHILQDVAMLISRLRFRSSENASTEWTPRLVETARLVRRDTPSYRENMSPIVQGRA